ncbi:MAG: hypothetical protein K8R38_07420 [Verrucomicrobia bacterium]|nr:hypothetical protein [Verrucomicrobiota bacterium]
MARPSSSKRKDADRQSKARTVPRRRVQVATTAEAYPDLFDREALEREEVTRGRPRTTKATVPKSLVKFIVGIFLAPLAWVLTQTFFQAFTTSLHHGLLATQSFGCFAAGMLLFGILFTIVPRDALMLPYVFGHEVTHAIWVKLFGGKVADQFHVSLEGGHVLTDRVNTWIALAPYFFPIYSLLVVSLYGMASLVADLSAWRWVLFLLLGVTLAFHLVFTCLLIVKGQPDLHYGGTFFSLMVIYLINLIIITGLLLATGKEVSLQFFAEDFIENSARFLETCRAATSWLADWIGNLRQGLGTH